MGKTIHLKLNDNIGSNDKMNGIAESIKLNGKQSTYHMKAELFDAQGNLKDIREEYNTVTTAGKAGAADQLLASPSLTKPTHMGVGTGSPSGTALGTELATRSAFDSKTRSTNVVTMVSTFGAGVDTGAITEAGVFDASSSGNMWLSNSFSVINKAAGDTLVITWTITFS